MSEIRMTGELRNRFGNAKPAVFRPNAGPRRSSRWAKEIVLEISVEKDVIVAIRAGEDAAWKGTLEGLKKILRGEIKAK